MHRQEEKVAGIYKEELHNPMERSREVRTQTPAFIWFWLNPSISCNGRVAVIVVTLVWFLLSQEKKNMSPEHQKEWGLGKQRLLKCKPHFSEG